MYLLQLPMQIGVLYQTNEQNQSIFMPILKPYCTYLPKLVVEGSCAINNFHSIAFELNTGGLEEIQKSIGLLEKACRSLDKNR